ncbi:TetR/AcrR family transcriptional regulator [Mesobacillus harenae]|uniref:TetR/AcrR family transcriptional regulator n=1 Tax=Mesobacillus harenae TaxID=2213203 RepID=UPI001580DBC7|nr:TetR/AcrR family transcriptional regulator [Mesobacillus harenae]
MDGKAIERRVQILEIALQLFAEQGYHRTKISDIVREAGVAQGTFYWYFKSKEAIALEIIESGQTELLKVVSQGYRQSGGTIQDAVKASEKLFGDLFLFSEKNKSLIELLLRGIETEDSVQQAIIKTRQQLEKAFQKNIERAIELGILPEKDSALQSALLMSLVEGILSKWLFDSDSEHLKSKTAGELAREVVRFEFFGLLGI